jgi:hypothetical protein
MNELGSQQEWLQMALLGGLLLGGLLAARLILEWLTVSKRVEYGRRQVDPWLKGVTPWPERTKTGPGASGSDPG